MAHGGCKDRWSEDEGSYSSDRDTDDSPILSYRNSARRYSSYTDDYRPRERRSSVTIFVKCCLLGSAAILFCVLMYIPVYNRANQQVPRAIVSGWSHHTNRDTKIYVKPNNITLLYSPRFLCPKHARHKNKKLFLLIIVASATENFEQRDSIRETWGNYENYLKSLKVLKEVREKYKSYNYSYDLYTDETEVKLNSSAASTNRSRRDIAGLGRILPELVKVLGNVDSTKTDALSEEKRFDYDAEQKMLPEFDMNKELGENESEKDNNLEYSYDDYESNIMKIPPKGNEDDAPTLDKVLSLLKLAKGVSKTDEVTPDNISSSVDADLDFRVVFILGLPKPRNDSSQTIMIENKIVKEVETHGDIIQEGFVDTYNNLTLKSIMMLKWITKRCNDSVRYVLKTDDDMYINVPNLILNLRNRSEHFDRHNTNKPEHLLIGDLICGARPVLDSTNKWYSPRYMWSGRVYPRYVSGTGYVFTSETALVLYNQALNTSFFHLEDIYITGICAYKASPRIVPQDDASFCLTQKPTLCGCCAHDCITTHKVPSSDLAAYTALLQRTHNVDICERKRLTKVRKARLQAKQAQKKLTKITRLGFPIIK